jgi:hypothetical protein
MRGHDTEGAQGRPKRRGVRATACAGMVDGKEKLGETADTVVPCPPLWDGRRGGTPQGQWRVPPQGEKSYHWTTSQ